jgi:hypothetical protein
MTKIIEYEVLKPLVVTRIREGHVQAYGIPEGGSLGFCGIRLYSRDNLGGWETILTSRTHLVGWMNNGHVKKKLSETPKAFKRFEAKAKELQQEAASKEQRVFDPSI